MHDNPLYDTLIVGAGPAGAQLAYELAQRGRNVALLEQSKNFTVHSFSSGAVPISVMRDFSLPDSIVESHWNAFEVVGCAKSRLWEDQKPRGAVCDFAKMRAHLVEKAINHSACFLSETKYLSHEENSKEVSVRCKHLISSEPFEIRCRVLVDATGAERKVIGRKPHAKVYEITGVEHHLEVTPEAYLKQKDKLSFYFGESWMPHGYGWIFPSKPPVLKVGIIRYFAKNRIYDNHPYAYYINQLIEKQIGTIPTTTIRKHGKTLAYASRRNDIVHSGRIIGIGDAVSLLNPLACEGIRHALFSAHIAAAAIDRYLEGHKHALNRYPAQLRRYCGWGWRATEAVMQMIYKDPSEANIDSAIAAFQHLSFDELLAMGFDYKLKTFAKFGWRYLLNRFAIPRH